jgi:uncharacterized protein (DUF2267 family)
VDYERFITSVGPRAGVSWEGAERAAQAVLETLAERLAPGQARGLADELPPELRPWISSDGRPDPFHADEFVRRVARREGVDEATADRHARAVFAALGRAVRRESLDEATVEFPRDFDTLLAEAMGRGEPQAISLDVVVADVADEAGIDRRTARRALDAVMETLAERVSHGEVQDLIEELPPELRTPLERGDSESHGAARPLSVHDFIRHVAEREGVPPAMAEDHARAVFLTLRGTISEGEFADMTAQLPDEYRALLARR